MRLAKQHLDIGLFTAAIEPQLKFWGSTVGLRLDHELEMAPGWVQHRYDANGSVVKVNHRADGLATLPPSGFVGLSIARNTPGDYWFGTHPGGGRVATVSPRGGGLAGIGITVSSPKPDRLVEFYREAMEFDIVDDRVLRCGDSLFSVIRGPGGQDADDFAGPGFRYITVQVFDADREIDAIVRGGGRVVRKAVDFAGVARYGFVADPDGNWIEISARTSLTGVKVR